MRFVKDSDWETFLALGLSDGHDHF